MSLHIMPSRICSVSPLISLSESVALIGSIARIRSNCSSWAAKLMVFYASTYDSFLEDTEPATDAILF